MEDDAIRAVQSYAQRYHFSLGKAASELIRRGTRYQLAVQKRSGLPVFDVLKDFPVLTNDRIRELLGE